MTTPKLTRDILLAALAGFQLDKQRIDAQIAEVQALLNGGATRETTLRPESGVKIADLRFGVVLVGSLF